MNLPDGLHPVDFCFMEGCIFKKTARCVRCGAQLRCECGRFIGLDGNCPCAANNLKED